MSNSLRPQRVLVTLTWYFSLYAIKPKSRQIFLKLLSWYNLGADFGSHTQSRVPRSLQISTATYCGRYFLTANGDPSRRYLSTRFGQRYASDQRLKWVPEYYETSPPSDSTGRFGSVPHSSHEAS